MESPEKTPRPEEPAASEEFFPKEPILPEGFTPIGNHARLPRARRRRAQRTLALPGAEERAVVLDHLARRAFPSFEFFLFAILCGIILGAAYLLNAPALLLLGILLAPLLTPWVGLTLAAVTGSWRFFFLTLLSLLVAGGLVFLGGVLAGLASHLWNNLLFSYARIYAQLWWPDLIVVVLGAALLVISFVRSEQKPILASVMLAYGLFLPISSAGIGLGIGKDVSGVALWPNGLLVFIVHLALATLVGGIVLVVLRFKPKRASGILLPIFTGLLSLAALSILTGLVTFIRNGITASRHVEPTPTVLILPSVTPIVFQTSNPVFTSVPSVTPTPAASATLQPTPAYAIISSSFGGGANLRTEPGGPLITVLNNDLLVEVLPEIEGVGTVIWVHVRVLDGTEGWVLQTVLTATALTPTPAPTP